MALTWNQNISDGNIITNESLEEMRSNINIERARRGLSSYIFNEVVADGVKIKLAAINEIYNAIQSIKACSIVSPSVFVNNETLSPYRDQLNAFNEIAGTPAYSWVPGNWEYSRTENYERYYVNQSGGGSMFPGYSCVYQGNPDGFNSLTLGLAWAGTIDGANFTYRKYSVDVNGTSTWFTDNTTLYAIGPYIGRETSGSKDKGYTYNDFYYIKRYRYLQTGYTW